MNDPDKSQPMLVNMSDIRAFKTCRQKWDFRSELRGNWTLDIPNKNLVAGDLGHQGLGAFYAHKAQGGFDLQAFYDGIATEVVAAAAKKDISDDEFEKLQAEVDNVRDALGYYETWSKGHDNFDVLGTEVEVRVQLPIELFSGRPLYFVGRADGWIRKKDGTAWLMEHKTCSRYPDFTTLFLDEQCQSYLWAAQSDPRFEGNRPIGTIYTFVRKHAPKSPTILKGGGLSKAAACLEGTTYDLYMDAIRKLNLYVGDYEDVLTKLQDMPNPFVYRTHIQPWPRALAVFGNMLYDTITEMVSPTVLVYPNPSWWVCQYCEFRAPCSLVRNGYDPEPLLAFKYKKREQRYRIAEDGGDPSD